MLLAQARPTMINHLTSVIMFCGLYTQLVVDCAREAPAARPYAPYIAMLASRAC